MHSDIETLERLELVRDLREGEFDVLVGINLLREGLDIPECALVAILDADKEGFLRSKTSLIQTIGRAARNAEGRVILYADKQNKSVTYALAETERRRQKQLAYNLAHHIKPKTIKRETTSRILLRRDESEGYKKAERTGRRKGAKKYYGAASKGPQQLKKLKKSLEDRMQSAARNLEFEEAIRLRDKLLRLEREDIGLK